MLFFVALQVKNSDDCVHEKFFADDLLALLPDKFPEKAGDDFLDSIDMADMEEAAVAEAEAAAAAAALITPKSKAASLKNMFSLSSPKVSKAAAGPEPEKLKKKASLRHVHGYSSFGASAVSNSSPNDGSLRRGTNSHNSTHRSHNHNKSVNSTASDPGASPSASAVMDLSGSDREPKTLTGVEEASPTAGTASA
jgi:hypothetical protein